MPESLTCYDCEREPTQQCPRCGRPYCDEHGDEFCGICLHPSSGVPSFTLYRGSLLALLVGTALAVWLLIQPNTGEGQATIRPTILTPTAVVGAGVGTTPQANQTPGATTPAAGTPATGNTPTAATPAAASPTVPAGTTPTAGGQYTVVSGDSLSGICEARRPARLTVAECVEEVRALNNLTSDSISVGQVLRLPQ